MSALGRKLSVDDCVVRAIKGSQKDDMVFILEKEKEKIPVLAVNSEKLSSLEYRRKLYNFLENNPTTPDKIDFISQISRSEHEIYVKKDQFLDHNKSKNFKGLGKFSPDELLKVPLKDVFNLSNNICEKIYQGSSSPRDKNTVLNLVHGIKLMKDSWIKKALKKTIENKSIPLPSGSKDEETMNFIKQYNEKVNSSNSSTQKNTKQSKKHDKHLSKLQIKNKKNIEKERQSIEKEVTLLVENSRKYIKEFTDSLDKYDSEIEKICKLVGTDEYKPIGQLKLSNEMEQTMYQIWNNTGELIGTLTDTVYNKRNPNKE